MQKVLRSVTVIVSLAIIAFSAFIYLKSNQASAAKKKTTVKTVGYVDLNKVINDYAPARKAWEARQKVLQSAEQTLINKVIKKYNTTDLSSLSPSQLAEVEKMAAESDKKIQKQVENIEKKQWKPAMKKIDDAIKSVAKKKKVKVVVEQQVVLYGGTDLTKSVLTKLK